MEDGENEKIGSKPIKKFEFDKLSRQKHANQEQVEKPIRIKKKIAEVEG